MIPLLDVQTGPLAATFSNQLGAVAELMMHNRQRQYYRLATLRMWILPAIKAGQIRIYYAPSGMPLGYVTWAWLTPDAEYRWLHDPGVSLHPSEWTDGEALWILDFMTLPGLHRSLLKHIRTTLLTDQALIKACRRSTDGAVRGVSTWFRRDGLWRRKNLSHEQEVPLVSSDAELTF